MKRASEREGIRERSAAPLSPRPSASRLSTVEMVDSASFATDLTRPFRPTRRWYPRDGDSSPR